MAKYIIAREYSGIREAAMNYGYDYGRRRGSSSVDRVVFIATCLLWRSGNGIIVVVVRTKGATVYAERGQQVDTGRSNGFNGNSPTKK